MYLSNLHGDGKNPREPQSTRHASDRGVGTRRRSLAHRTVPDRPSNVDTTGINAINTRILLCGGKRRALRQGLTRNQGSEKKSEEGE